MQAGHIGRHTRRGFYRGDSAPKFFPVTPLTSATSKPTPPKHAISSVPPELVAAALAGHDIDFSPHPSHLLHHSDGSLSAPSGHAFLSWLADQLAGQATGIANLPEALDFSPSDDDDWDPSIEAMLDDKSLLSPDRDHGSEGWSVSLPHALEAGYAEHDELPELAHLSDHIARGKMQPEITPCGDGGRVETYATGSRVVKDILGRVIEVHSHYGESLFFRYGVFGKLEHFQRTDAQGKTHSEGRRDKHGVIVRDAEGRARAAGESMTVDPRGCFYLHSTEGQYFCLDLVTGIHSERRAVTDESGGQRFITSVFTHDGFRMATMFGTSYDTECDTTSAFPRFRFYGRDGTVIEFASEDDLHELNPALVSAPAACAVSSQWLSRRQGVTAWESVHDYLMRVS